MRYPSCTYLVSTREGRSMVLTTATGRKPGTTVPPAPRFRSRCCLIAAAIVSRGATWDGWAATVQPGSHRCRGVPCTGLHGSAHVLARAVQAETDRSELRKTKRKAGTASPSRFHHFWRLFSPPVSMTAQKLFVPWLNFDCRHAVIGVRRSASVCRLWAL